MISQLIGLSAFIALVCVVSAVPIPNGVVGYPQVTCGEHSVGVKFDTEQKFSGRVYVKGEVHRPECQWPRDAGYGPPEQPYQASSPPSYGSHQNRGKRQSSYSPQPHSYAPKAGDSIAIDVKFGQCNMRRQRTLSPRGVEYTFTVVISFHKLFLTKIDRAYRVRCFYMETTKTVDTVLDVSMLTTSQVNEQYPMPQCYYNLKKGHDGQYARFARVGEKITHLWNCDHKSAYVYGILVHSCYVDDGAGNKVLLIDKSGCSVDQYLVGELTYDEKLISASVETHVFKYADKSTLQFQCSVQLCFKNDGGCEGITPPKCGGYPQRLSHHPAPATHFSGNTAGAHSAGPVPSYQTSHSVAPSTQYQPAPDPHPAPSSSYNPAPAPQQSSYQPEPASYNPSPAHYSDNADSSYPSTGDYGPPQHQPDYPAPQSSRRLSRPYNFGPPIPSLRPFNPINVPYKDSPVDDAQNDATDEEQQTGAAKVKRAIEEPSTEVIVSRRDPNLDSDLMAPALVVLPFDVEFEDDTERDILERDLQFLLPSRRLREHQGVCMSSTGASLLVALFVGTFLFAGVLALVVVKRNHTFSYK